MRKYVSPAAICAFSFMMIHWLATAQVVKVQRRTDHTSSVSVPVKNASSAKSRLTNTAEQAQDPTLEFVSQTSGLLWSGTISLAHRGDATLANVMLAADAIDMTVLHPHEVFSFNDLVGIRSEEKGYKPGLMYSNGEVVQGVGGGICIVSTLLYRAALETGLRIIERHPHSGPVSYSEPGLDAAVAFGCEDLSFKNNTDALLLVRAVVKDSQLKVALYGTQKPDRTVEVLTKDLQEIPFKIFEKEDPTLPAGQVVVEQKARPGFSVTTLRLIKENGKLVSREVISHDIVPPSNKIMRVPPKPDCIPEETAPVPVTTPIYGTNLDPFGSGHQFPFFSPAWEFRASVRFP